MHTYVTCIPPPPIQVFNYGFRSSRKFQKRLYIWDFLEKSHEHISSESSSVVAVEGGEHHHHPHQMFLNVITRISANNTSIGKDEKVCRCMVIAKKNCQSTYIVLQRPN